MSRIKLMFAIVLIGTTLFVSACSPEATRTRSGGPGADIGNRSANVDMHGNVYPTYQEPERGQAIQVERNQSK